MAMRMHHSWASDIKLIAEVEKHPCLYDRNEEHFTNNDLRKEIWKEIADTVGITDIAAKQRYRHIRDSFLKRLRKSHGNGGRPLKSHRFANYLKFLLPHINISKQKDEGAHHLQMSIKRRRSEQEETDDLLSAVSVMVDNEGQHLTQNDESEVGEEVNDCRIPSVSHCHPQIVDRRRRTQDHNADPTMGYFAMQGSVPQEDELDSFFKTISATVRKLTPVLQSQLRFQIMEMVYKAELGHLENE